MKLLFTKKPQSWLNHTKAITSVDIDVGDRTKDRLKFLGINQKTLREVKEASQYILPYVDEMVELFYESLIEVYYLNQIITDHSTVERLKVTQRKYIQQLLSGNVDREYIL